MNTIEEVKTLTDYVRILEKNASSNLLFRGQSKDWPLLPKIARSSEYDGKKVITLEQTILANLYTRATPHLSFDVSSKSNIELLMIGQHYGLATRLMDWTTNPLAALWFALKDVPKQSGADYSVVWIFDVDNEDNAAITGYLHHDVSSDGFPHTQYFIPEHIDKRIVVQKSVFVIHGNGADRDVPRFTPMEQEEGLKLKKILIPRESVNTILKTLNLCGIDNSSIFPDLEGLCRQINFEFLGI